MKAFLPLLLSFFFIISCQQHKEVTISPIDEEDELQEEADSLPRATAIFWLDKYHMKELKKDDVLTFRTAKAKVGMMGQSSFCRLWNNSLGMHNDISVTD